MTLEVRGRDDKLGETEAAFGKLEKEVGRLTSAVSRI